MHRHLEKVKNTVGVCNIWCRQWRIYDRLLPTAFLSGILLFLLYFVTFAPPLDYPSTTLMKVSAGQTIEQVGEVLKEKHIIRSVFIFTTIAQMYGVNEKAFVGEYFFPVPETVITLARRFARGDYELVPIRVTIPEGKSVVEIAKILNKKIPDFDTETFITLAKPKEGYLFPDTYFFLPGQEPESVIAMLTTNFIKKIQDPRIQSQLAASGHTLEEVVTMAALLEKEAPDIQSRRIIAGILWKRISIGMPLQVDAVFPYIIGKNTFELTRSDLKTDSLYNTYVHKGLPPGPITNPSIESIVAAMTPVRTDYLFYLSDRGGTFHYSLTYAGQRANQKQYLGN